MVNYSTINRIYQADNNIREVMQAEVVRFIKTLKKKTINSWKRWVKAPYLFVEILHLVFPLQREPFIYTETILFLYCLTTWKEKCEKLFKENLPANSRG